MVDRLPRKLAAILYADVVGYSRLTGDDEDATHRMLSEYLDLISATIESHHGQVKHYAGDAVLAKFDAVVDAMSAAVVIQDEVKTRNEDVPDTRKVIFRIGVNLGDVIEDRGDIYGDGVNVAARLEALAEPGGICISDVVRSAIGNKLDLKYEDLGRQEVKNIAEPVHAYRVVIEEKKKPVITATQTPALDLSNKPAIAVLPFTNMSGDPEQEYFSDGITEDIITELSRFQMLVVIARHSSFAFKGQAIDIKEIGKRLGVRYVVEGSVRKVANRVRISAQLIDATTGAHIWAERYDRAIEDIFDVQDEVTDAIAATLPGQIQKSVFEQTGRMRTESLTAYDCLLRGNWHYHLFTRDDLLEARRLYKMAIELDPRLAQAYSRLADTYNSLTTAGWETNDTLGETMEVVRKALALDSNDSWARIALAWALLRDQQFEEAEEQFENALAFNRHDADCMSWVASGFVCLGRAQEGHQLIREAMHLSPLHPNAYHSILGNALYFTKRFKDAVGEFKQSEEIGGINHANLAAAYGQVGRITDARMEARKFVDFRREQIEINGEPCPASDLELALPKVRRFRYQVDRTFFSMVFARPGWSN